MNFSCSTEFSTPELQNNFSKEQIDELQKITEFFKNQICKNEKSDFKSCFSKILPDLLEYGYLPIFDNINFDKQKELYKSISNSTFEEIWTFGKATYPDTGKELKSMGSTYNGKYQKFIIELGKNNTEIKKYAELLVGGGDFEPMGLLEQWIYLNPADFDLDNPNIQLLIAVHYLSHNDQNKRTDKWDSK